MCSVLWVIVLFNVVTWETRIQAMPQYSAPRQPVNQQNEVLIGYILDKNANYPVDEEASSSISCENDSDLIDLDNFINTDSMAAYSMPQTHTCETGIYCTHNQHDARLEHRTNGKHRKDDFSLLAHDPPSHHLPPYPIEPRQHHHPASSIHSKPFAKAKKSSTFVLKNQNKSSNLCNNPNKHKNQAVRIVEPYQRRHTILNSQKLPYPRAFSKQNHNNIDNNDDNNDNKRNPYYDKRKICPERAKHPTNANNELASVTAKSVPDKPNIIITFLGNRTDDDGMPQDSSIAQGNTLKTSTPSGTTSLSPEDSSSTTSSTTTSATLESTSDSDYTLEDDEDEDDDDADGDDDDKGDRALLSEQLRLGLKSKAIPTTAKIENIETTTVKNRSTTKAINAFKTADGTKSNKSRKNKSKKKPSQANAPPINDVAPNTSKEEDTQLSSPLDPSRFNQRESDKGRKNNNLRRPKGGKNRNPIKSQSESGTQKTMPSESRLKTNQADVANSQEQQPSQEDKSPTGNAENPSDETKEEDVINSQEQEQPSEEDKSPTENKPLLQGKLAGETEQADVANSQEQLRSDDDKSPTENKQNLTDETKENSTNSEEGNVLSPDEDNVNATNTKKQDNIRNIVETEPFDCDDAQNKQSPKGVSENDLNMTNADQNGADANCYEQFVRPHRRYQNQPPIENTAKPIVYLEPIGFESNLVKPIRAPKTLTVPDYYIPKQGLYGYPNCENDNLRERNSENSNSQGPPQKSKHHDDDDVSYDDEILPEYDFQRKTNYQNGKYPRRNYFGQSNNEENKMSSNDCNKNRNFQLEQIDNNNRKSIWERKRSKSNIPLFIEDEGNEDYHHDMNNDSNENFRKSKFPRKPPSVFLKKIIKVDPTKYQPCQPINHLTELRSYEEETTKNQRTLAIKEEATFEMPPNSCETKQNGLDGEQRAANDRNPMEQQFPNGDDQSQYSDEAQKQRSQPQEYREINQQPYNCPEQIDYEYDGGVGGNSQSVWNGDGWSQSSGVQELRNKEENLLQPSYAELYGYPQHFT